MYCPLLAELPTDVQQLVQLMELGELQLPEQEPVTSVVEPVVGASLGKLATAGGCEASLKCVLAQLELVDAGERKGEYLPAK
jgi:hypothetical protein